MERSYLVFWQDMSEGFTRHADVIKLDVESPCAKLCGAMLDDLIRRKLCCDSLDPITGIVELANPLWSPGAFRDVSIGDGRAAVLECQSGHGWSVHL